MSRTRTDEPFSYQFMLVTIKRHTHGQARLAQVSRATGNGLGLRAFADSHPDQ
ncbi:MAG: hypothetical protein LC731_08415 [Acidobacteria bacterium]|nr:hypothetical protein [Acidobacteriota bacterium]